MQLPAWARIVLPTVAGLLTFCCVCGTCATLAQGGGNPSTVAQATATYTTSGGGQALTNAPTATSATTATTTTTASASPTATGEAPATAQPTAGATATTSGVAPTATAKPTAKPTARPTATTPKPTATPKPSCPAPAVNNNPWCLNWTVGNVIYDPPSGFCSYFSCIGNFGNSDGYVVQCNDGMFATSGGKSGSCSSHGGEKRPLLRP